MASSCTCMMCNVLCMVLVLFVQLNPSKCEFLGGVCQEGGGAVPITYTACSPSAEVLIKSAVFNVTVMPETATCGTPRNEYCSEHWQFGCTKTETCDSADPAKKHPKDYMVDDKSDTWWLSLPSSNRNEYPVTIQISFDKLYELSSSIMLVFHSGRPREMIIEKSLDRGITWTPLQYYSQDCNKYSSVAGVPADLTENNPTAVICTSDYSAADPKTGGIVRFPDRHMIFLGPLLTDYKALFEALQSNPALQEFLSFTNLRFRLLFPAIIGNPTGTPLGDYYAISRVDISGRCSCNLHASSCSLVNGFTMCSCEHNTQGTNCEVCQPLYNDRPWMKGSYTPYPTGTANECKKCECNEHAQSCTYDPNYGRGICHNCIDRTQGNHCEECMTEFYHNTSVSLADPNTCIMCNCELLGIVEGSVGCSQVAVGGNPIGQCPCKPQVSGRRCDTCQDGFYGLLQGDQPGTCKACGCNLLGTIGGSNTCDKQTGQCPCKTSTDGRDCGQCKAGYHTFPIAVSQDCTACGCDWGGSVSDVCDASTGECSCKPNVQGAKCTQVASGGYFPYLDVNVLDPASGTCTVNNALQTVVLHDGQQFARCQSNQQIIFQEIGGQMKQPQIQWPYQLAVRYTHNSAFSWPSITLAVTVTGNSGITDISEYTSKQTEPINGLICSQIGVNKQWTFSFQPGQDAAWLTPEGDEILLDVRCRYQVMVIVGAKDPNDANNEIVIDSVVLLPSLARYQAYSAADNATKIQYDNCLTQSAALSTKASYIQSTICRSLSFSVATQINVGAQACNCDPIGTLQGALCDQFGGQCTCKSGVSGRRCDTCAPGYYNFTDGGCTACNCDRTGSESGVCDVIAGQCPCLTNVARAGDVDRTGAVASKQCTTCKANHHGFASGTGCSPCNCNTIGSLGLQCDQNGQCPCKDTITGLTCGECMFTFYQFSVTGCLPCDCTSDGVSSSDCNKATGACSCKTNTMGNKCDQCKLGYFDLQASNAHGCQKCFCYGHGTNCTSAAGFVEMLITDDNAQSWEVAASFNSNYVKAPQKFLGNMAYSYGQTLSLDMMSESATVNLAQHLPVILEGQGIQLSAVRDNILTSLGYTTITIPLHESYWSLTDGTLASVQQLQGVLADLQAIYIQNIYLLPDRVTVAIRNIIIKTATEALAGDGRPTATYVEECSCDPSKNVAGLSCQSCSQGNQRPTNTSTPYESCRPCSCNGKENGPIMCEEMTGKCLNCRNGTMGTNCEICSPNVVTSLECNKCQDGFWGLFAEGCIDCNCDGTGSSATTCLQDTGQCACKNKVTGRRCDKCEDNYFDLTNTGCQVCDECYVLVQTEVNSLRQLRDNLTNYVQVLHQNDNNTALGPFTERLLSAETNLMKLQQFLTDATNLETNIASRLVTLNNTLTTLLADLSGDPALLSSVQSELDKAKASLQVSQNAVTLINNTVYSSLTKLLELRFETGVMTELVNAIVAAKQEFNLRAGATANVLQRLENEAINIEAVVADAKNVSSAALQMASSTNTKLGAISNKIAVLQTSVSNLNTLVLGLNQTVSTTLTAVQVKAGSMTTVNQQVADLVVPSDTVATGLQAESAQVKQSAQTLQDQALADAQSTTLTNDVRNAVSQSSALLTSIKTALGQSEALLEQVKSASAMATEAETLARDTFVAAENMLNTIGNFNTIIADLKQQTQNSLDTVSGVRTLSQEAIAASKTLREQLRTTFNNAELALQQITTAESLQRVKKDELEPVNVYAGQLQTQSTGVLNNIEAEAARVNTANITYVSVGVTTCNSFQSRIATARNASEEARLKAQEASAKVTGTRDRAQNLLRSLQNLNEIDVVRVQQLKSDIEQNRQYFDSRQLAALITDLRNRVQIQQGLIDSNIARKNKLKADIESLRVTQGQLVQGTVVN